MLIRTLLSTTLLTALIATADSFAAETKRESDRDATIRRAIELHDAGSYDAAITVYQSLLEEDPNDGMVLYEIAMSYAALKDHANCITYARRSSRIESGAQAAAIAMVANCQDHEVGLCPAEAVTEGNLPSGNAACAPSWPVAAACCRQVRDRDLILYR